MKVRIFHNLSFFVFPVLQAPKFNLLNLQNCQATSTTGTGRGPGRKKLSPPPETLCASANKNAAKRDCGVPQSQSCGEIFTYQEPYFIPRGGFPTRSPSKVPPQLKKGILRRSRPVLYAESVYSYNKIFKQWDKTFGKQYFYADDHRR